MNKNLQTIKVALQKSWSKETGNSDDWSIDNPSLGQCAITACIVQDYLGGGRTPKHIGHLHPV